MDLCTYPWTQVMPPDIAEWWGTQDGSAHEPCMESIQEDWSEEPSSRALKDLCLSAAEDGKLNVLQWLLDKFKVVFEKEVPSYQVSISVSYTSTGRQSHCKPSSKSNNCCFQSDNCRYPDDHCSHIIQMIIVVRKSLSDHNRLPEKIMPF